MGANRNQEALTIFKRIVQAKPESINAYDSLTDAYESVKDYTMAQKTLEKAISLANIKGDYDTAAFQQRLSRLTNRKDVD
jgi:tetratricopeptide (TPR) repeat protein